MKQYCITTPEETERWGQCLATLALASGRRRLFVALFGEMGVGKTALVRGFTSTIAPAAAVRSPTYTVVNEYRGGTLPVFHFDMYRIEDGDDLFSIGYTDYLAKDGYILCEWSENIPEELPAERLNVTITRGARECDRIITAEGEGYEDLMP